VPWRDSECLSLRLDRSGRRLGGEGAYGRLVSQASIIDAQASDLSAQSIVLLAIVAIRVLARRVAAALRLLGNIADAKSAQRSKHKLELIEAKRNAAHVLEWGNLIG
jgi:hypothetical protein